MDLKMSGMVMQNWFIPQQGMAGEVLPFFVTIKSLQEGSLSRDICRAQGKRNACVMTGAST